MLSWLAAPPANDPSIWAQYGALGAITAGLVWFARGAHQRERERADRLEAETRRLNEVIAERAIPALMAATKVAEQATALLASMQRERELGRRNQTGGG